VRDTCQQILECVPQAANLSRIRKLLKNTQWEGLNSSGGKKRKRQSWGHDGHHSEGNGKAKGRRYTREQLDSVVQASEGELSRGLRENNVIEVNGEPHLDFAPS
jgi:sister chromatid cohesion protein DCC1